MTPPLRLLTAIEVDTIRVALELLRTADPNGLELAAARETESVAAIISDEQMVRLVDELRIASLVMIPMVQL